MELKLKTGDIAPDFELPDQHGAMHRLADYAGKWVLLYFYPKDDTTGCTAEACAIRDNFPDFEKDRLTVLGISTDSVKSHAKFARKYGLPFLLLADEKRQVVQQYGVWGKKKFMGREYEGTHRVSFLVGPDGRIAKIYQQVKPESHAREVLDDHAALRQT